MEEVLFANHVSHKELISKIHFWVLQKGNGNPFQYSCLGNTMDRGAWQGCKELGMTGHACMHAGISKGSCDMGVGRASHPVEPRGATVFKHSSSRVSRLSDPALPAWTLL